MTNLSSFDPYAREALTSGDFHSDADEMNTRRTSYNTANSSAAFRIPAQTQTFEDFVPRPVETSTQQKFPTKRNLEEEQGDAEELPAVADETPDTPRTSQRQALAEAISTAISKNWNRY